MARTGGKGADSGRGGSKGGYGPGSGNVGGHKSDSSTEGGGGDKRGKKRVMSESEWKRLAPRTKMDSMRGGN